jgi:protein-tyrosine-phosphatase
VKRSANFRNSYTPEIVSPTAQQALSHGLSENQKIRVVLAGMNLPDYPANTRTIVAQEDKQVFDDKAILSQLVDQFHVGQALLVRTDLVSAFYDVNALVS